MLTFEMWILYDFMTYKLTTDDWYWGRVLMLLGWIKQLWSIIWIQLVRIASLKIIQIWSARKNNHEAPATPFQVVTLVQTSRIELLNGPFVVPKLQRISSKHLEVTILRLSIPVLEMVLRRFHQRPFYSLSSCVVRRLWEPFLAPWTDDSSVLRSWWSLPAEEFKGQGLWMAWHLDVPLCLFSGATPSAQQELCRMVQAMGMRTAHKATNFPTPAHPQWG